MTSSTDDKRADSSAPRGTSKGAPASARARFARTNALRNRGFRNEERARDLIGCQTAEHAECQRNARLGRENRMTRREYEAKDVVTDVIVDCRIEIGHDHLLRRDFASDLFVLSLQQLFAAVPVNGAMFCGGHEPGASILRHARRRPLFQRSDKRVLSKIL